MTETEWDDSDDLERMLDYLRGTTGRRKALLFVCECYRGVCHLSAAGVSAGRTLLEVAGRYADARASEREVIAAARSVAGAEGRGGVPLLSTTHWEAWTTPDWPWEEVAAGARWARERLAYDRAARARPREDSWKAQAQAHRAWLKAESKERRRQAALLRDLFGPLPFRPVVMDPAWLAWNAGTVCRLAEAAYQGRQLPAGTLDRARLGVLADALEEAGCTQSDLLNHLRGPGPHVRGCWAVDLLSGREGGTP